MNLYAFTKAAVALKRLFDSLRKLAQAFGSLPFPHAALLVVLIVMVCVFPVIVVVALEGSGLDTAVQLALKLWAWVA